jgi:SDR family mycofactocin-dependent oxidoreductase
MGLLDGKVAFITGAARGQGRSHAVRLAAEGADIIAVDICAPVATIGYETATLEDLAETVRQVEALDRRIVASQVDIRDLTALTAAVTAGVAQLGRLDVVLANAGIFSPAKTIEMDEDTWSTMIDINLTGAWKTLRAAAPSMIEAGNGGAIVITSSLASMTAHENMAHYSASKAGLVGLMKVVARELAPHSIRVNSVHPTTVATPMILNDSFYKLFRPDLEAPTRADFEVAGITLNALPVAALESSDVTDAVLYLVADSGRYVTGSTLVIDAGSSLLTAG